MTFYSTVVVLISYIDWAYLNYIKEFISVGIKIGIEDAKNCSFSGKTTKIGGINAIFGFCWSIKEINIGKIPYFTRFSEERADFRINSVYFKRFQLKFPRFRLTPSRSLALLLKKKYFSFYSLPKLVPPFPPTSPSLPPPLPLPPITRISCLSVRSLLGRSGDVGKEDGGVGVYGRERRVGRESGPLYLGSY